MGERLRIEISVAGLRDISNPAVFVSIGSSKAPLLIRMNSLAVPLNSTQNRSDQELIVINIPALPLTPGDYWLDVQIKDGNKTVDFVTRAGQFRVNSTDLFGAGYRFDSSGGFDDGYFVVPWDWELRPAPDSCADTPHSCADTSPFASTGERSAQRNPRRGMGIGVGESGVPC